MPNYTNHPIHGTTFTPVNNPKTALEYAKKCREKALEDIAIADWLTENIQLQLTARPYNFKEGDVVRCVQGCEKYLTLGKLYKVNRVMGALLEVAQGEGGWHSSRFELAEGIH